MVRPIKVIELIFLNYLLQNYFEIIDFASSGLKSTGTIQPCSLKASIERAYTVLYEFTLMLVHGAFQSK